MQMDKIKEWMALAEQCGDSDFWTSMLDSAGSVPGQLLPSAKPKQGWSPAVDVVVTAGETIVWVELPGVRKEDLNVAVTRDTLIVRGFKKSSYSEVQAVVSERYAGSFERSVRLPHSVDTELVGAKLQDGLLVVRLKTVQAAESYVTVE